MKQNKKQANQYDKIFKENIDAVIPSLMQNVLGITAISMEELPDDIQHTKERKPDVLKKVTDSEGNTFVLQIEFQVANEAEMVYRMGEYYFMLGRKYKLPIRQFVIFIGSKPPKMVTKLEQALVLSYEYSLISLAQQDYHIFLKSNQPEEIVLAVLADFAKKQPENALKQIIARLEETTESDLTLKKYFKQLRILAQLRKLEQKLKEIIVDNLAKYIDEERDVAYMIALDKSKEIFVINLLTQTDFGIAKIANLSNASIEFVKSVQQKLTAGK